VTIEQNRTRDHTADELAQLRARLPAIRRLGLSKSTAREMHPLPSALAGFVSGGGHRDYVPLYLEADAFDGDIAERAAELEDDLRRTVGQRWRPSPSVDDALSRLSLAIEAVAERYGRHETIRAARSAVHGWERRSAEILGEAFRPLDLRWEPSVTPGFNPVGRREVQVLAYLDRAPRAEINRVQALEAAAQARPSVLGWSARWEQPVRCPVGEPRLTNPLGVPAECGWAAAAAGLNEEGRPADRDGLLQLHRDGRARFPAENGALVDNPRYGDWDMVRCTRDPEQHTWSLRTRDWHRLVLLLEQGQP